MKQKKFSKIYYYVFILLFCIKFSQINATDCSGCQNVDGLRCSPISGSCDTNCKPKYGPSGNCYDCSSIPDYYHIEYSSCVGGCQGTNIVYYTKECTSVAVSDYTYKLGDVYYFSGTIDTNLMECSSNICTCKHYYNKENKDGKAIYTCTNSCSNYHNYHNYGSKECISSCSALFDFEDDEDRICYRKEDCNKFIEETSTDKKCVSVCSLFYNFNSNKCITSYGDTHIYQIDGNNACYASCSDVPGGDYIYEGKSDNKCYKLKPSSDCEFFYTKVNGIKKCAKLNDCVEVSK